jgi:hypothetical protein
MEKGMSPYSELKDKSLHDTRRMHRSIIKYKQEPCIYSKKVGAEE